MTTLKQMLEIYLPVTMKNPKICDPTIRAVKAWLQQKLENTEDPIALESTFLKRYIRELKEKKQQEEHNPLCRVITNLYPNYWHNKKGK